MGIITNSGGTGVELADLFEERGLLVPALSPDLRAAIASVLPPHGSATNPIDITTQWERFAKMYARSVEALMESEEVDAVVPVLLQRSALMPTVTDAIIAVHEQGGSEAHGRPFMSAGWHRGQLTLTANG